jgi:hypothetical protein
LLKKANLPVFKKPGENEKVEEQTRLARTEEEKKKSVKFSDEDKKKLVKSSEEEESCCIIEPEMQSSAFSNEMKESKIEEDVQIEADAEAVSMETDEDSVKIIENDKQVVTGDKEAKTNIHDWELDMQGCFETEMECDMDVTQEPSPALPSGSTQSNSENTSSFSFHASDSTLVGSPRKITSSEETTDTSQMTLTSQSQNSSISEPKFTSQPFNSENPFNFDCATLEGASSENILDSCDSQSSSQLPRRRSSRRSSVQQQLKIDNTQDKRRRRGKNSPRKQVFGVAVNSEDVTENSQSLKKVEKFSVFGLMEGVRTPPTDENSDQIPASQLLFSESPTSPTRSTLGKPPTMVLVEETQSPEKFNEKFLNVQAGHDDSVRETPVKELELESEIPMDGSPAARVLFDQVQPDVKKTDPKTTESLDTAPKDSKSVHVDVSPMRVVISSADPKLNATPVVISSAEPKLNATPVVKLKKLTNAEIDHYSPRKAKEKSGELISESENGSCLISSQESSGRSSASSQGSRSSSQRSRSGRRPKRRGSRSFRFSHGGKNDEMEDLAEIIESDDFVPSSQGFDASSGFTAIKYMADENSEQVVGGVRTSDSEVSSKADVDHVSKSGTSSGGFNPLGDSATQIETIQGKEDIPVEVDAGSMEEPNSQSKSAVNSKRFAEGDLKKSETAKTENKTDFDRAGEQPPIRRRGRPRKVKTDSQQSIEDANAENDSKVKNKKSGNPETEVATSARVDVIPETEVEASAEVSAVARDAELATKETKKGKKKKLFSEDKQAACEGEPNVSSKKKKKSASKLYVEDIFNRKCNLDVGNDSDEEDVPLQNFKPDDPEEDVPLMSLLTKDNSKLNENEKNAVPESCDLFENHSEAGSSASSDLKDVQNSQSSVGSENGKKKSLVQSEERGLCIDVVSTMSKKQCERGAKLARKSRRNSLSTKKVDRKSTPRQNEDIVEDTDDAANKTSNESENTSENVLGDVKKKIEVVSKMLPETCYDSEAELEDICQHMPEYRPEVRDLISRPILNVPEFEKVETEEVTSASPNDLQGTPRSAKKQSRFLLSRHKTSSPQFVRSRGMRLVELASQSATKSRPDREVDFSNTSSTPKIKPKQISCMTDPVRRHRLSRVDLILAKSKEILAKRESVEEPCSQAPNSPTNSLPLQENFCSPESTGSILRPTMSPVSFPRYGFRTIIVKRIYSPSASPSAGILKKRKLSGNMAVDSPSPPNKVS